MFHVRPDERPNRPNRPNLAPIVANIPASSWLIMMTHHVSADDESQPNCMCQYVFCCWWTQVGRTETWAHWSRGLIASHQSDSRGDCEALKAINMSSGSIWFLCAGKVLPLLVFHSVIWRAERTNATHRKRCKSKSRGTSYGVKTLTCSLWEELGRISSISSFATLSCCKQR